MPRGRLLQLGAIGLAAGLFSGLFGVGGGVIIVPLLTLWVGVSFREATATSLVAIVIAAGFAAGLQALYGNVRVQEGLTVGIPAVAGVVAGAWLQQRMHVAVVRLIFSAMLLATAIILVVRAS